MNLVEILKDCPEGTKFYSSIYGELIYAYTYISPSAAKFVFILPNSNSMFDNTPIKIEYYWNGKYVKNMGECTLFPSKDQRDWSKFTAPWYKKEMSTIARIEKQGEQTTSQINERAWLYLVSDVLTWKDGIGQYLDDPRVQELAKKLCSKYSQKLYNPSILSNSSNTGKNEQKFDPKTLKPFDKVLMRDSSWEKWNCQFFSHIINAQYPYAGVNGLYKMCIPYNDETKHLVGTTEEAPKYYRYWED